MDGDSGSTPSLTFDFFAPPTECVNWMLYRGELDKWLDFWGTSTGNPVFWIEGSANSPECQRDIMVVNDYQAPPPPDSNITWQQAWPPDYWITSWHQDGWSDNGDGIWSFCDTLNFSLLPDRDSLKTYHIENVTQMLGLWVWSHGEDIFVEFIPPGDSIDYWDPLVATIGTCWQVVRPPIWNSRILLITDLADNNSNGVFDLNDEIVFEDKAGTPYYCDVYTIWTSLTVTGISSRFTCGDANSDGDVNVSDAVYIINYVFVGGDPPNPLAAGDVNCDGTCNVSDAVWIINYVFVGGNMPCDTTGDGIPDC
jgi:hypothetical protein